MSSKACDRRKRNTEQVLLALFDAHARIQRDLVYVVQKADTNSDAKETALEARERASEKIAECAVDRVGHELEMLDRRYNDGDR